VLAAKAGAKHVYAIEASGLAVKARENIAKNGFKDTITFVSSFGRVKWLLMIVSYRAKWRISNYLSSTLM